MDYVVYKQQLQKVGSSRILRQNAVVDFRDSNPARIHTD